jgi:HSP20 family protein
MLMRTDPFRDFDRLTEAMLGSVNRPSVMPMDAYREGETFVVHFDLPGVDPDSIDLTVEQNVLTVHAERRSPVGDGVDPLMNERTHGVFSRQLFLGETLDTDNIEADYSAGVLTLRIPVAEQAKPRKVSVSSSDSRKQIDA